MNPSGGEILLNGEETFEPVFGLKAKWIPQAFRDEAERQSYTVVEARDVLVTHVTEVIKEQIADLITMSDLDDLIDGTSDSHRKIIDDMVPNNISKSSFLRVIQHLLEEQISIRDLGLVIEAINEVCASTKNIILITEHVRSRLARQICAANVDEDENLNIILLSDDWENEFLQSLIDDGNGMKILGMAPLSLQNFITQSHQILTEHGKNGKPFVILTVPAIRPYVRSVIERFKSKTIIMSQNEVHPKVRLNTIGYIGENT